MSSEAPVKSFIPQVDGQALDFIKISAAALMVIDHMNAMWFDMANAEMNLAGRIVFPLFAYAVAIAVLRGGFEKMPKYAARLLLLGVLAEPVIQLVRPGDYINVIFTLAAGAACAGYATRAKDWQILAGFAVALASLIVKIPMEFGIVGAVLPAALLLVLQGRRLYIVPLIVLLFALNLGSLHNQPGQEPLFSEGMIESMALVGVFCSVVPYIFLQLARSLPQTGRYLPRYFLHVFYPGHMVLLWLIAFFCLHK